jgi:hypothetical protein
MADTNLISVNRDLDQLHNLLIDANEKLSDSLQNITDPDLAQGVVREMREVVHRIDLVQSLLFTASSNRITAAVGKVKDANAALTAALKSITDLTKLVKNVTGFLTLVDKAIDVAKVI